MIFLTKSAPISLQNYLLDSSRAIRLSLKILIKNQPTTAKNAPKHATKRLAKLRRINHKNDCSKKHKNKPTNNQIAFTPENYPLFPTSRSFILRSPPLKIQLRSLQLWVGLIWNFSVHGSPEIFVAIIMPVPSGSRISAFFTTLSKRTFFAATTREWCFISNELKSIIINHHLI